MKSCKSLLFVSIAVIGFAVPSLGSMIRGNSSHGLGDGVDSWNETGSLLGVSTTSLAYNTFFPSGQQAAPVYAMANGSYEQVDCSGGGSCDVGDSTAIDFVFQIPVSQIQNGMVSFANYTGSITNVQALSCDKPAAFSGNAGPGFLCTTYAKGYGNLNVDACQTGTTVTFILSGSSLPTLGSVTFLVDDPNTASSLSAPTLTSQPAACAAQPSILVDFVAAALPLANTPCTKCVNGTTPGTLGLSAPMIYIPQNTPTLELVLYYQDNSYAGDCKLTFSITRGQTVLTTVSKTLTGSSSLSPGTVGYGWMSPVATPTASPGAAVLHGSLKCGPHSIGITGPLNFQ